jgi:hypothetical protein
MTKQNINIGVAGNDATGDAIRDAFRKVNENFNELYTAQGSGDGIPFTSLSDYDPARDGKLIPETVFVVNAAGNTITAKRLTSSDESVKIDLNGYDALRGEPAIDITTPGGKVSHDTHPQLGGDLDGQGQFYIYNIADPDSETAITKASDLSIGGKTITVNDFVINKGYADTHYVNVNGDTMTGALNVTAGATGNAAPRRNEVVGRAGDNMTGSLLLNADPTISSNPLTAATKNYVDISSFASSIDYYVSNSGRTYTQMIAAGILPAKIGRALAYAFATINEACYYAEVDIYNSSLEPGPYKQPISINNGADTSFVYTTLTNQTVGSTTGLTQLTIKNGASTPNNVDQGNPTNIDLTPGKLIIGGNSGAIGTIYSYSNSGLSVITFDDASVTYDTIFVTPITGTFQPYEPLFYDNATPKIQITVNVESGIYDEHLPIRVPRNVSIIGSEMRRTIIRPKDFVSISPWVDVYFYRDKLLDGLTITTATINSYDGRGAYAYHYLKNPDAVANTGPVYTNAGGYSNAAYLMLQNKAFIQAEAIAYMAQVRLNTTYNQTLFSRDVGLIVDAIATDLLNGGNNYSLNAASKYYGSTLSSGAKADWTAGINYIATLASNILVHTILAGDTSPPKRGVVAQVYDSPYTIEQVGTTNIVVNNLISTIAFGFNASFNPPKNNKELDLFMMNDATGLKDMTLQGHGGFAVVLDPEGQIITKSPYIQNCSSISASLNTKAFRGGAFIDGNAGKMPVTITTSMTYGTLIRQIEISGLLPFIKARTLNSEIHRKPNTPTAFYTNGKRVRIEKIIAYNDTLGTATLTLGDNYYDAITNIVIETAGNRSMLATHFTQVNDLGFGVISTNNSLIELVSVFTYYNSTAVYALNGGQIRSVGGSNCNGYIGLKAEGSDPNEIPRQAILADNLTQMARVYKKGAVFNGSGYNSGGSSSMTVYDFEYIPYSVTEIQVNHPDGGRSLYMANTVTPVVSSDTVLALQKFNSVGTITMKSNPEFVAGDKIRLSGVITAGYTEFNNEFTVTSSTPIVTVTATYASGGAITNAVPAESSVVVASATSISIGQSVICSQAGVFPSQTVIVTKIVGTTISFNANILLQVVSGTTFTFTPIGSVTVSFATTAGYLQNLQVSNVTATLTGINGSAKPGGKIARLTLGSVASGAAATFTENLQHGDYIVLRTTQNFKFFGNFTDISARPSTALDFLTDGNISTYRTIALSNTYYSNSRTPGDGYYGTSEALNESPFVSCTFNGTISGLVLTVNASPTPVGAIISGLVITGSGVTGNVIVGANLSANTWTITNPNNVSVTGSMIAVQQNNTSIINVDSSFSYISCVLTSYTTIPSGFPFAGAYASDTAIRIIDLVPDDQTRIVGMEFGWSDQYVSGWTKNGPYSPKGFKRTITSYTPAALAIDTVTRSNSLNTIVTVKEHNYKNGDLVIITSLTGANAGFNTYTGAASGYTITRTGTKSFTYSTPAINYTLAPTVSGTGPYIYTFTLPTITTGVYQSGGSYTTSGNSNAAFNNTFVCVGSTNTSISLTSSSSLGTPGATGSVILANVTIATVTTGTSNTTFGTITLDSALPASTLIPNGTSIQAGLKLYGYSTTTGTISSSGAVTTIALTSGTTFLNNINGAEDARYVRIDNEYFLYTGISGNTITGVTRAQMGSVAAAHASGATVYEISGTLTANISTCRATSHDFLNIGVGGYNQANFPNNIFGPPSLQKLDSKASVDSVGTATYAEVQEKNRGRVFFASTNQDGFFRVGRFFTVDQGTGTVSFNAAIVLTGLSGIGFKRGVYVSEFSNDTSMPAVGDAVPTNTAVRSYIDRRLGIDSTSTPITNNIGPGFLSRDGSLPASGNLVMGTGGNQNFKITFLGDPTAGTDATNKTYVDQFLKRTGGTRINIDSFVMNSGSVTDTVGITNITKYLNVVTVVTNGPHSLSTGQPVKINNANNFYTSFNVTEPFTATVAQVVSSNTFNYAVTYPTGPTLGGATSSSQVNATIPSNFNVNSNRIVNLGAPGAATDAANKAYVDYKSSMVNLTDVAMNSPTGPVGSDIMVYNSSTSKWVNGTITGDVSVALGATGPTGSALNFSIGAGKITNTMVSGTAAIDQGKLSLDYAKAAYSEFTNITALTSSSPSIGKVSLSFAITGTSLVVPFPVGSRIEVIGITPSTYNGIFIVTESTTTSVSFVNATTASATITGSYIRAARGLSSFNNSQFTVSNGHVSIAPGGIDLTTVGSKILSGLVIGNVSGAAAVPTGIPTVSVIDSAISNPGSGVLVRTSATAGSPPVTTVTYNTIGLSTSASASTIVQRDTVGNITTATMNTTAGLADTSGTGAALRLVNPGGAAYATATASVTGAIKIKLPVGSFKSSTLMAFTIQIYEYNAIVGGLGGVSGLSRTIRVGGQNSTGNSTVGFGWTNPFAQELTQGAGDINVRFGYDSTSDCIWIGELNTVWTYPQVFVTDFQAGYNNYAASMWGSGWAISFASTFDTVSIWGGVSLTSPVLASRSWSSQGNNTTAGTIKRTASGTGYLDGNYNGGGEFVTGTGPNYTTTSPGPIYSIGNGYAPTTTTFGNMFGIGFCYTASGAARTTLNGSATGIGTNSTHLAIPDNIWGQYVTVSGTINIFLGTDGIMYGTAAKARYADLAENYAADQKYEPGTVLMIGGEQEVTLAKGEGTRKVAGVVSTNPAYHMNMGLETEFPVALALQGRVPCKVIGKVSKGDMMVVSMVPGVAMSSEDPKAGSIIGKALADYDGDRVGVIEVLVGKH